MDDIWAKSDETPSVEIIDTEATTVVLAEGGESYQPLECQESSVQLPQSPKTVGELLRLEGYYKTLAQSFVFIQNKKGSADDLIDFSFR